MGGEYKNIIYGNYRTMHNDLLYGRPTLDSIRINFSVWKYYYAKHFPTDRDAVILDIGCGEGSFVYFLTQLGYKNVSGIDLSEQQIELGNQLGIQGLQLANLYEFLESRADQFDFIIALDVLEHFTKAEAFDIVRLILRSLKQGGYFLMQVPNGEGIFMSSIYFGDFTHEVAYSHLSVRQVFLNAGFSEVMSYPLGPVPNSLQGLIRFILWKVRVVFYRFGKMVETGNAQGIFTSNLIAVGKK